MDNSTALAKFTATSRELFDSKINNWVEGVLLTIDADNFTLTVHGAERPYASVYARMLKRIHAKTAMMVQSERDRMASEIRLKWMGVLAAAYALETHEEHEMTFQLPCEDGIPVIVDERPHYNRAAKVTTVGAQMPSPIDTECNAIHKLIARWVGECVVVGCEGGPLRNNVYAVIRSNKCSIE